jgi:hypothetical protein
MKKRKLTTYNVIVEPNKTMAGQWLEWRDLHIYGDLSDGGEYSFGFLIGSNFKIKDIYNLFKIFCINNKIELI